MIERPVVLRSVPQGVPSWMISLADLLALMLTFFVLLFSMNAVQLSTWQAVVTSFRQQFNPHAAQSISTPVPDADAVRQYLPPAASLDYLSALMEHRAGAGSLEGSLVLRLPDRVVLSLPADATFEKGTALLIPEARTVLANLAEQFSHIGNKIVISGHMGPGPVNERAYRSVWEMSLRRADVVAQQFEESGYKRHLSVMGYGTGRYDTGLSVAEHQKQAVPVQRVDIEILAWSAEAI